MNTSLPHRRQKSLDQQYAVAKNLILRIGFIIEGSLSKSYLKCGKPTCRCSTDAAYRHGPYYQLTWKRGGKTVSQAVSKSLAHKYEQWIGNRQTLSKILKQMYVISAKAIELHLESVAKAEEKTTVLSVNKKLRKT